MEGDYQVIKYDIIEIERWVSYKVWYRIIGFWVQDGRNQEISRLWTMIWDS